MQHELRVKISVLLEKLQNLALPRSMLLSEQKMSWRLPLQESEIQLESF